MSRKVKVTRIFRGHRRTVPFLRFSGDWLHAAGFRQGEKVNIQVENGRLVITPEAIAS